MAVGVGASGYVGIAPEAVPGTYVAPTKFLVLTDESMQFQQETKWRRPLRGIADVAGGLPGNSHVAGDVSVEITHDTLPHILLAARGTTIKTGTTPNFTYTFTPTAVAVPTKTLSITVVRNGVAFGFVGCVVGSQAYTIDDGTLMATFSITGRDEGTQSVPTPTHTTTLPYGAGEYKLEIPTASQVFDADAFSLTINDGADPQFRIGDSRAARFIKFGERSVELTTERDFESRTDFDNYKALVSQSITLKAGHTGPARDDITFLVPQGVKDSYEISGMSGQAELIRASITNQGVYDATTSKSYSIVVKTSEDVTV